MRRVAIMLFGSPGAGKGAQANLLADKLGIIHLDPGKFLEALVHDPSRQREELIKRERRLFDTGKLMTPSFVLREMSQEVRQIAKAGRGLVCSGSPRTLYEAGKLTPLLEKLYQKKNVFAFVMNVPQSVSLRRNSARLVCSFCKAPLLTAFYPSKKAKYCPVCGGKLYRRSLDKPEVIKIRLKEYENRTEPVFAYFKKRKYKLHNIDARPAPHKVFQQIYKIVHRDI